MAQRAAWTPPPLRFPARYGHEVGARGQRRAPQPCPPTFVTCSVPATRRRSSPTHPLEPGRGLQQAAGRHGDQAASDAPPTCTPFLPRGRGASRGPRCSAPQARISPPWSSIPAAAGSSAACLRPWPPTSGCPGNWAPSLPRKPQALAGWELWTLVTAGGRRGQPDQPSVSQHPERPGQLLPGGSTDPNTGSQS